MSQEGTFKKVEESSEQMYGSKGLLVCGYPEPEQQALLSLLRESDLSAFPVIFATNNNVQMTLKEIFESDHKHGHGEISDMNRAAIMSGFTQNELHTLMASYRASDLPTQLWAALTPISENWSVADLLNELSAEHEAINKQKGNP
ncbi:MAG: DUF3783 domain-containing protein [Thermodesulfobacteriota bacterium]|nr:DUF3783 domain-containing protein [Thermodesulfobacteriota bacterium]